MSFRDRQEMGAFLEERMTRSYTDLSERQVLEPDTALIKTYVIEAHMPEGSARATPSPSAHVQGILSDTSVARHFPASVSPTEDPTLFTAEGSFENREPLCFFFDTANPRFWVVHSVGSSRVVDWTIGRLVRMGPRLDHVWLPPALLEKFADLGSLRGLGLAFDRRLFDRKLPDVPDESIQFLKMQLWGNRARRVLEILRASNAFPESTTLAKIKIKYCPSDADSRLCTLDDIRFDGKLTARGTSFSTHLTLVDQLVQRYQSAIAHVEKRFSIEACARDSAISVMGEPLIVRFGRPITDLDSFLEVLLSCSEPFRLWGVPIRIGPKMVRVRAVDLHVGARLDLEVTPEFVRAYLPKGSCGNTLLRLGTNLQHHYDSLTRLVDSEDRDAIQF